MSTWGVVVAAGRGVRADLGQNKVFYELDGRSILSRCLDNLASSGSMDGLVLVISREDRDAYAALCEREGTCPLVKYVVDGGQTRQGSVYNGLRALPPDASIVAVHDAARPFVNRRIVEETIRSARLYGSGVICTPVVDTIKIIGPDGSVKTPDRSALRAVQTPQTFVVGRLLSAHARAAEEGLNVTDDAMLFEHYYGSVRLVTVDGAEENIKLTTKADFEALENGHTPEMRVGYGWDAHRLAADRDLVLCGTRIAHDRGLLGHSDADVAVHALMDALLGAAGKGDIGRHFPDSDPAYEGISSMILLRDVMAMLRKDGWHVVNADVTIIAQRPRLAPYMDDMRTNLAGALGTDAVNVKATTSERMGFEGEELGISAQAVCLLTRRRTDRDQPSEGGFTS
ncbi:MAG: 2-C-methyl-D-erythritol 2,4-cyclodiphosphate synthase [Clostridia bacterium]|nr:2-C-methyl-D-erythritol 2,4-cyclodiphosphate synthase [Clostridia bacterium]